MKNLWIFVALALFLPVTAGARDYRYQLKVGPVRADFNARIITGCECDLARTYPTQLADYINVWYGFTPPRQKRQQREWNGRIETHRAEDVNVMVIPDDRWNVREVYFQYANRDVKRVDGASTHTFNGLTGYRQSFGDLNGIRPLRVTIIYEDFEGNFVGTGSHCITVDSGRY